MVIKICLKKSKTKIQTDTRTQFLLSTDSVTGSVKLFSPRRNTNYARIKATRWSRIQFT